MKRFARTGSVNSIVLFLLTNRWSKVPQGGSNTAYSYDANGNLTLVNYLVGTTDYQLWP